MANRAPLMIWALILGIGAMAAEGVARVEPHSLHVAATPDLVLTVADRMSRARLEPTRGAESQHLLAQATQLRPPSDFGPRAGLPIILANWTPPKVEAPGEFSVATISAPSGAEKLLRVAMEHAPARAGARSQTALAALEAVSASSRGISSEIPAYGELETDMFAAHRLTILQLGDSHTAADFFSGRVRERLQQVFGTGGDVYLVPGKPHLGVRSAMFESDASSDWNYEALQKPDAAKKRFYLTGFNAIARHAGAALSMRSRGGRPYDRLEVAFLKQPGGGRAEVLLDGAPSGEINLDGAADERATLEVRSGAAQGFREVAVRAVNDSPVTVTGVQVGREGDGVSYLSLGFPGATVQLLQKLATENVADDFRRMEPDIVVLAFGTNEGFNDNLDVANYISQYEQIVRRLQDMRPGLRVVIIGPSDAARPAGVCHAAGVGQSCDPPANTAQMSATEGGGQCKFPTPPKLNLVREAQRKLAQRMGVQFWDWSSVQPGPCGAQTWAAANPPLMAHDYVHMTLEGYKQSADRFADFLIPLIDGRQTNAHVVSNN